MIDYEALTRRIVARDERIRTLCEERTRIINRLEER